MNDKNLFKQIQNNPTLDLISSFFNLLGVDWACCSLKNLQEKRPKYDVETTSNNQKAGYAGCQEQNSWKDMKRQTWSKQQSTKAIGDTHYTLIKCVYLQRKIELRQVCNHVLNELKKWKSHKSLSKLQNKGPMPRKKQRWRWTLRAIACTQGTAGRFVDEIHQHIFQRLRRRLLSQCRLRCQQGQPGKPLDLGSRKMWLKTWQGYIIYLII